VVSVLVRYQDAIQRARRLTDFKEALTDLLPAEARIDEDARVAVPDEQAVPGTAAGENADPDDGKPPASE
jgi:hypothetical protein